MSDTYFWRGKVVCSICGHESHAVVEIPKEDKEPILPMECGGCGNMTSQPKDLEKRGYA